MSAFIVDIINETDDELLPVARLQEAAQLSLLHEGIEHAGSLSILLTGDDELQRLNLQFRGEDKPTDVLSFPVGEPPGAGSGESGEYLGDIAISIPTALRQAQAGGHDLEAELLLLAVHGVLHLLGYDHLTEAERENMWSAQAEVLSQLGVDAGTILGETTSE